VGAHAASAKHSERLAKRIMVRMAFSRQVRLR
jgi:hypothetical protein